jgi:hypothetical protein
MTSLPVKKLVSGRIFPKKSISLFSTYFHFLKFYHIENVTLISNMSLYFAYRTRWRHNSPSKFFVCNPCNNSPAEVRNWGHALQVAIFIRLSPNFTVPFTQWVVRGVYILVTLGHRSRSRWPQTYLLLNRLLLSEFLSWRLQTKTKM